MKNILSAEFWENIIDVGLNKTPVTLEGLQKASGGEFKKFDAVSHQLSADEIDAIRQSQSKGFQVIDIDPNALDKENYFCCYDDSTLSQIVGVPVNGYGIVPAVAVDSTSAPNPAGSPRPYWRTVEFSNPGTFLMVKFLPVRALPGRTSSTSPDENPYAGEPQNTDMSDASDQFFGNVGHTAGGRTVLIDFEKPSKSPLLASDGTCFKSFFSSFFVTFKQMNVRIRLIVGYNSEISETEKKEETLHMFGGQGLTKGSPVHPVNFCFTDHDLTPGTFEGINPPNALTYGLLLWCPPRFNNSVAPAGLGLVYLTGLTCHGYLRSGIPTTVPDGFEFEVLQVKLDALLNVVSVIKKFTSTVAHFQFPGGGPMMSEQNFTAPIRVNLRPFEGLAIRTIPLHVSDGVDRRIKFSLRGYGFGSFIGTPSTVPAVAPFQINYFFKENPFPQDVDTVDLPRR